MCYCLQELRTKEVTETELRKARDPVASAKQSILTSNSVWLGYMTDLQNEHMPKHFSDIREVYTHIESISVKDVELAIKLCIRPGMLWATIGTTTGKTSSDIS